MPSALFTPLTLRSVTARNRIWVAPMCQYSVERRDGIPTEWHFVHLGSLARGGAGVVVTEATAVVPEGRISPEDTGIWSDEQADAWRPIVDFIHGQGALAGMQLAHAGRKASTWRPFDSASGSVPLAEGGWPSVAPSAIAFDGYARPSALDSAGIDAVVEGFGAGTRRALDAGFDLVEVHAAHGYLLHQFLSPLSNTRTDRYGGSFANRIRLCVEVVDLVRQVWPNGRPVFVRISATDWTG